MNEGSLPWLHIRSQFTYHSEATVLGTRVGLENLRDAISAAIESGAGECECFASDGEGYKVAIVRSSTIAGLGKPTYLDVEARELAQHEYDFLTRQNRSNREIQSEALEALRWCRQNGNPHTASTPTHAGKGLSA